MLAGVHSTDHDHLSRTLTGHVNVLLNADMPDHLASTIARAALTPLQKPSGGLRPIAVGEIWRRLASKVVASSYRQHAKNLRSPLQVGVGVPLGTEGIIHSVNQIAANLGSDRTYGLLKFDFCNAFNTIQRSIIFSETHTHFPGMSR